jgi:hypothetical protein
LENVIVASVAEVKRKQSMEMIPPQLFEILSPIDNLPKDNRHNISYTVHLNSLPANFLAEETREM